MSTLMKNIRPLIRKYFSFLEDQYHAVCDDGSDIVVYRSKLFAIRVWLEREQIFVDVSPVNMSFSLDLGYIIRFKRPELDFKYPRLDSGDLNPEQAIQDLANFLKAEGTELLKGNFSIKEGVEECMQKHHRQLGL